MIGDRLIIDHLSVTFSAPEQTPDLDVIDDFSAVLEAGSITAVIGPSGCGKTTLLNVVAGLVTPTRGRVFREESGAPPSPGVAYVFQTAALVPWLSIWENALFGARIRHLDIGPLRARCADLLRVYGLEGFEQSYPFRLSGGMQQRVSIIRAALSGARTILLDEPFANSDYFMQRELQREISRLVAADKLTAILVTHDVEAAARVADKIIVLTPRPARTKQEIVISLPRDERLSKTSAGLQAIVQEIWASLLAESGDSSPTGEAQRPTGIERPLQS